MRIKRYVVGKQGSIPESVSDGCRAVTKGHKLRGFEPYGGQRSNTGPVGLRSRYQLSWVPFPGSGGWGENPCYAVVM